MKIRKMIYSAAALLALASSLALASCSNDDFLYHDQARVRLVGPENYTAGSDSLNYTFSTAASDVQEMVMPVDVEVMGPVADHDRIASVAVDETKTTAGSDLYSLPKTVTVEAGKSKAVLQVTLKRSALLQTKAVRLYLKVEATSDFAVGVNEQNHLLLIWSDMISKPANWDDDLKEFFGEYSDAKYRFMLANAEGMGEFDTDTMTWAELQSYKIKFVNALNAYNEAHPDSPLTDEDGVLVSFD